MRLISFNFTKISAERFKDITENIKFNTKIDISSIEPIKSEILKGKEELIKIGFIFSVFYDPEFAKIELAGNFILSVESKISKEILKGWKDKKTTDEFRLILLNLILRKSNIKSLELEEELGLPPHIPLPSLNKENTEEKKEN